MDRNIINSGSITYALRGRDSLRAKGYNAYMFRKQGKSAEGCGYSISTNCPRKEIERIFESENIKYISINTGEGI